MPAKTDDPQSSDAASQRPAKRRRGTACTECSDRKIRCDGARPICDSCRRRHLPPDRCVYADGDHADPTSNVAYIKQLEQRVHELEASISDKGHPSSKAGSNVSSPINYARPRLSVGGDNKASDRQSPRPAALGGRKRKLNGRVDNEADDTESGSKELPLGESSISGFIKQAHETLENPGSYKTTISSRVGKGHSSSESSRMERLGINLLSWPNRSQSFQKLAGYISGVMLPSRQLSDRLLQVFWDYEYALMPLFHRPSFLQRYNSLWQSSDSELIDGTGDLIFERGSFYCLLFSIMSLCCRDAAFNDRANEESGAIGETLLEQAKQLLYSGLLESGSIEVVQAIIYMAMYLRRMGNHHEAWIFIGLASRLAQAVGIHYAVDEGSQVEREVKRRTWYGCVILDSMHTTVFGQAPISAGVTLPLPSMIDDIYMETDPSKPDLVQPPNTIPDIAFYIFTTKLSSVTVNILRSIYNTGRSSLRDIPTVEFRTAVLRCDSDLQLWQNELPSFLRYEKSPEPIKDSRLRLQLYLRVRYLDCRFLLFRASILRLAGRGVEQISALQESMVRGSLESCTSSIRELIDIFREYRDTPSIPGPKHNVVCLLTAATVLALVVQSRFLATFAPADEGQSYGQLMRDCMKMLRSYDRTHFPMKRKGAADAVERLMNVSTADETRDRVVRHTQELNAHVAAQAQQPLPPIDPALQQVTNSDFRTPTTPAGAGATGATGAPPPLVGDMDIFDAPEFLGDFTADLQNPAMWVQSELDPFGFGFPGDFGIQNVAMAQPISGSGNLEDSMSTNWLGTPYGQPWWPTVG